jgi:hypothetical protein
VSTLFAGWRELWEIADEEKRREHERTATRSPVDDHRGLSVHFVIPG